MYGELLDRIADDIARGIDLRHGQPEISHLVRRPTSERGRSCSAVTSDQDDARGLDHRWPQEPASTRFLSPLRAVSTMTFSALRLIMPIIGIFTSTDALRALATLLRATGLEPGNKES